MAENDWSETELRAAVEAYIEMLNLEQSGSEFSKTDFRNRLRAGPLASRTDASIEFRMRNISAVMDGLGRHHIIGYRPAGNVGARIEASLAAMIADVGAAPDRVDRLDSVLKSPEELMGVKAVFGLLSSHVLCFGGRGSISDRSYFSVAAGAARRAVEQPFIITIGGGKNVRDGLEGRVLNMSRASLVYGPTSTLVTDPAEASRLAQWPVAIALHDAWRFVGSPHLVTDLGFPDRRILAGAQDGIVRPEGAIEQLWQALQSWPVEMVALPLPANFYDPGRPTLAMSQLPVIPLKGGAEEGERVWRLQKHVERDPKLSLEAKRLNAVKHGRCTCEACGFSHSDTGMFDAHHPTPLAVGKRVTLPEHLEILCPTCHRRAHVKRRLEPFPLFELRAWNAAGRP